MVGVWWLFNLALGIGGLPRWRHRLPHAATILCALAFLAGPLIIERLEPWLLMGTLHAYSASGVAGLLVANIVLMSLWRWYAPLFLVYWAIYLVVTHKRRDGRDPSPDDGSDWDR